MNVHLKEAFSRMKPVCDMVMINPSPAYIVEFETLVSELKVDVLQELHQYMLFPFITHLQSKEIESKYEMQRILVNGMRVVIQRVKVTSYEMCLKIEMAYMNLIFDKTKKGMVANVPEELKLSVMECLTTLMINLESGVRLKLLQTQIPLLAQAVFLSVHLAKLEKLRALRIAAIESLNAHIACHKTLTDDMGRITDVPIEKAVVNMTSTILPGVLAALQDVATCADNPGHAVIVAALDATHRILCLTMNDKFFKKRKDITAEDFICMLKGKEDEDDKDKKLKNMRKLSREWYTMAGDKLRSVMKSMVLLVTHEHYRVRRELAVLCHRVLIDCSESMLPSLPLCVEVLICLSNDPYSEVASYCSRAVDDHFSRTPGPEAMESLRDNFLLAVNNLPRVLNNIDENRKLCALDSVLGYVRVLVASEVQRGTRPPHLRTSSLALDRLRPAVLALVAAAALDTPPELVACRPIREPAPLAAAAAQGAWRSLRHVENGAATERLHTLCGALGELAAAPLLLDLLLDELRAGALEPLLLINWIATGPKAPVSLPRRLLGEYLQEELWDCPLEASTNEAPPTVNETYDVTVYNPRAWTKDHVPGLYEGATETRYTDMSYLTPHAPRARVTIAAAQRSVLRRCLLVEGVGLAARRLGTEYQPYLLKSLCPVLETVGSQYSLLQAAGLHALHNMAAAFSLSGVAELLAHNADYCTSQITNRLKKSWSIQSALQILSVVMEYSDVAIADYLYGIVDYVLVQSCDRYHLQDPCSFLMVFLAFVTRVRQWFPDDQPATEDPEPNVLDDVMEFIRNQEQAERLMSEECEGDRKSAEEMYREDVKRREEEVMDYDDSVTAESEPIPQHVKVTVSVIERCIHFVPSPSRAAAALALRTLSAALPVLAARPDTLLPLVHAAWAALLTRLDSEPPVLRACLHLLLTLAALSKDFIRSRTVQEVLPTLLKFLRTSSADSHLADAGCAYRLSQAFALQCAVLEALPQLVTHLRMDENSLAQVMACTHIYLSRKQPKPLQELSVAAFKTYLSYNYGATWQHLRRLCNNQCALAPPPGAPLAAVCGTPYEAQDPHYDANIRLIFDTK